MHLNFLDTSPLKDFASRTRSILPVCAAYFQIAVLTMVSRRLTDFAFATHAPRMHRVRELDQPGVKRMAKRKINYPHNISFRLTDEAWVRVEQEVAKSDLTPHDWCREAALEKLNQGNGLSRSQRILFEQFVCTHYLLANGFQLLADDKLSSEEWKKLRVFVKEKVEVIAGRALADLRLRTNSEGPANGTSRQGDHNP